MDHLPFPPDLATDSASKAREGYEARRGSKMSIVDTFTVRCALAFRNPEGRVIPVYDPYRPTYPEGCEPGRADVTWRLCFYPNETTGYEWSVQNFEPLEAPA